MKEVYTLESEIKKPHGLTVSQGLKHVDPETSSDMFSLVLTEKICLCTDLLPVTQLYFVNLLKR